MSASAIDELAASPRLPQIVGQLNRLLEEESVRRAHFRGELTEEFKGEFINGEVIMHSPATYAHILVVGRLSRLLGTFASTRGLGVVTTEKQLVCLTRNDYEPDLAFFAAAKAAAFTAKLREFPAPELAIEVLSESTEGRDRGVKFEDYAAHGVEEYWLVDPDRQAVEQYALAGARYELHRRVIMGDRLVSLVVTGFDVPVAAIFEDAAQVSALAAIISNAAYSNL